MTAGDYQIQVKIDAWTATIAKDETTDPAAVAITVDPLTVTWGLTGAYPSQPTATTATFGLYVPSILTGPKPVQGSRVALTITTPDHDPAKVGIRPVLEFDGLVTGIEAAPYKDGLRYSLSCSDFTSTLGEERIGDEPWPNEQRLARLQRVVELSHRGLVIGATEGTEMVVRGIGPAMPGRDIDSAPTGQILQEIMAGAVLRFGFGVDAAWVRPIVSQSVDPATGAVSLPIVFLPGGLPDLDAALPYRLAMAGGVLTMVRKAITPDSSLVAWIPSSAIEADSVTWRQDKSTNTNRVRATGDFYLTGTTQTVGSLVVEFTDLVNLVGPNEIALQLAVDTPIVDELDVEALIGVLLGTHYDASPRWSFDSFTVRAEEIAAGDQWPRLFNPRTHAHIYDQAAGKLILITDVAARWNLHDRPDYFGRLAGATLTLSGGKIRFTPTIAHRLPVDAGREGFWDTTLTHHPISPAELAAGLNPAVNQAGNLTPADLELVEH